MLTADYSTPNTKIIPRPVTRDLLHMESVYYLLGFVAGGRNSIVLLKFLLIVGHFFVVLFCLYGVLCGG